MSKKIKSILSILFVAIMTASCFCIPVNAADDDLKIKISSDDKDSVTAKVGDTVKYAVYMSQTNEKVIGIQMSFFYDDAYLKMDADSVKCESFPNSVGNTDLKNYYIFTWTDVQNPVTLNSNKSLVSAEFKVLKGGETDLSYFISDIYGDDMTYLKSYKITCKLWVNGEEVKQDAVPIVDEKKASENKLQGDFINYVDGMGEENTPNKDDHKSVIVEKRYIATQKSTSVVDVTKTVETSTKGSGSGSSTTIIIIVAIAVVLLAAGAIILVKKKDDKKKSDSLGNVNSDENNEN